MTVLKNIYSLNHKLIVIDLQIKLININKKIQNRNKII